MSPNPLQVLLVEDNPGDARLVQEALAEEGAFRFHLEIAKSLAGALELLKKGQKDIILLDLTLPDSSGLDSFIKLRDKGISAPVIVLTGFNDDELAAQAIHEGAQDYLVKGQVSGSLLVRSIRYAIERKQIGEMIQQNEQQYRAIFNGVGDAIFVETLDERILDANRSACEMYGYTHEEILTKTVRDLVPSSVYIITARNIEEIGAKPRFLETINVRKNGEQFPIEISIQTREWSGQQVNFVLVRDITDRKKYQEALQYRLKQLEALNQISQSLTSSLDMQQVLSEVVTSVRQVSGFDYVSLFLTNEKEEISRSIEDLPGVPTIEYRARSNGLTEWIWRKRQPILVDDVNPDGTLIPYLGEGAPTIANPLVVSMGIRSCVGFPLVAKECILGIIFLYSLQPYFFKDQFQMLTTLASQAAVAIDNARLFEQAQKELAERKQAEAELRQSEMKYRNLFDNAEVGMYRSRLDGSAFLDVNKRFANIFGYTREEILSIPAEILWADSKDRKDIIKQLEKIGAVSNVVVHLRDNEGKSRYGLLSMHLYPDESILEGSCLDITDQRNANEAVRQSEQKLHSLFAAMRDAIFVLDTEGRYLEIAPTNENNQVRSSRELLGRKIDEFFSVEDCKHFLSKIRNTLETNKPDSLEYKTAIDGQEKWFSAVISPLSADSVIWVSRDITAVKQAELVRQSQAEELARLYRATGALLTESGLDLASVSQTILQIVEKEFGQSNIFLFLLEKESDQLSMIASPNGYQGVLNDIHLSLDGPGLVSHVIRTGQSINTPDVTKAPLYFNGWLQAKSELTLPLKVGDQVIGALDIESSNENAFSADDERMMTIFADRAALALEHARLFAQTEQRMKNLLALRRIDQAISSSFDIHLTLDILLDQMIKQTRIQAAAILIYQADSHSLELAEMHGFHRQTLQPATIKVLDSLARQAVREKKQFILQEPALNVIDWSNSTELMREGFHAFFGIPLVVKGQVKGVVELFQIIATDLTTEEFNFLEMLSGQAAIAIDNNQLFENLQNSNNELRLAYDETIEGWAQALDLRDEETEGHSRRVTDLTIQLAQAYGYGSENLIHMRRGALLHDIGKLGVPDEILHKVTPLTDEDWKVLKNHPQFAYDLLSPITYLKKALEIPYCHHENWDGSGYPRGLVAEAIPLAARIFSIIDAYDALTSDRVYRKAWPKEKALQYIKDQTGIKYDPKIVPIFLHLENYVEEQK